ncbi:2693_t:CDS:2, partial [Scutellospora calospora]
VVTGHSLGGALAVFAALDIKQFFKECNSYGERLYCSDSADDHDGPYWGLLRSDKW